LATIVDGDPVFSLRFCIKKMNRGLAVFFKSSFTFVRRKNRLDLILSAWRIFVHQGFSGLRLELLRFSDMELEYEYWIELNEAMSPGDCEAIRSHISRLSSHPLISILVAVDNVSDMMLRRVIQSVIGQSYPFWELCIAYAGSLQADSLSILEQYAQSDPRIRLIGPSQEEEALFELALRHSKGEFLGIVDCDSKLAAHALFMAVEVITRQPGIDLIYSDEDKLDEDGRRFAPNFKPSWNPDLLLSVNYLGRLLFYRTALVRLLGGFRKDCKGLEDWDLALRVCESIPQTHVHHIPYVLYHGRNRLVDSEDGGSTSAYLTAAKKILSEHLERTGTPGEVCITEKKRLHVCYSVSSPPPLVSIIIPTRNGLDLLHCCIKSLRERTRYSRYEILVVDNQSDEPETLSYLSRLEAEKTARVLRFDAPFNYSAINNFAVGQAHGSIVCLMNNDIEVISEDWLDEMAGHAWRPEIGAVGAKLLYPDETVQHAGVLVGMGGCAGHLYLGLPRNAEGYMGRAAFTQNLSAVTAACLVVRKAVYEEVGGLDEENLPVGFNDIDFCLRILERGYRNLWTPFAELYHHESASRGRDDTPEKKKRFQREVAYMQTRWKDLLGNDPAHSPNLSLDMNYPRYAWTPRTTKPWLERVLYRSPKGFQEPPSG
jgi:GT2 family glycosyltransferase